MIEANCSREWPSRRSAGRALALAAFIALAGCQRSDPAPEASATPEVAEDSPSTTTAAVKALSALGRAEILVAVAAAADEVAAGNPLPKSNIELANRSFELTMPIACGDGANGGWGSWSFDPATKVLRVSFSRQNWAGDPLFADLANGQPFETAEGFWIERPWTRSEQCPRPAADAETPETPEKADSKIADVKPAVQAAPDNRLALVQYFSSDAPRKLLRGKRPYAYTAKLAKDAEPTPRAFRIRIEGRITAFGDGQPVHCVNGQTTKPPVCAVAVEFGKITLEDAATGEPLADWDS
ncbi:hypothetical protein [Novosphingobium taihuense]|uniref:Uncharacterized protein n=1 Tax=Novosphingobium taihuense TaxID=260085 RepID=A0A7W7AEB6_9SPHN|nr:hypothetical protein [Novosphingobium taihuense]MBB4615336.1 hypothetical protein [Novosphingobium taihuense]TWH84371.1 hypothetical protein IQ25_02799 [Novosphingobium taihuense]